jgi:hypothetical protein
VLAPLFQHPIVRTPRYAGAPQEKSYPNVFEICVFLNCRIGKKMTPAKTWFDKLTTLSKVEGQSTPSYFSLRLGAIKFLEVGSVKHLRGK